MKLIDIHSPQDIKPLGIDDLKDLAKQMRAAIINYTSTIGGHVGPNLGDVEALIGVHYVFDAPKDKIVIDVSGEDKKKLTVPDLLALFSRASGSDEANDKMLLS